MTAQGRPTNELGNYFATGVQTAKDTEATNFYFWKHLDGTGYDPSEDIHSEREGGGGQEIVLRYKTRVKADGQAVANARGDIAGRLLAYVLGQDTASTVATAGGILANHLLQPVASLPYVTVEQAYADLVERQANAQFTSLDVEGEAGKPVKLTAHFVSGGSPYVRTATLAPTRETGPPFFHPGASFVLDGAGNTAVTKFKVSVKRGVDDAIQTTALNRDDVIPLNFDVDLDYTLKYTNATLWGKVHYGGGTVVPIDLATGAFSVFSPQTGNGSNSLQLAIPLFNYTGAKVNRLDPDGKTMYIDVAGMTIKGATNSIFANVISGATGAYTSAAT